MTLPPASEFVPKERSPNGVKSAYSAGCVPILVPDGDNVDDEVSNIVYARVKSLVDVKDILN